MTKENVVEIFINPLQFLDVDEPWASHDRKEVSTESVISYMCQPNVDADLDSIISRYKEISVEEPRLFAAPHEERILDKLIWPLKHAKSS